MLKRRKGNLLPLILIVVVAIVAAIIVVANKSHDSKEEREARVLANLREYESVVNAVCGGSDVAPRMPSSNFSSVIAYDALISKINAAVSSDLQLVWDDVEGCWATQSENPNGGRYILTVYPTRDGEAFYELSEVDETHVCFSIWDTSSLGELELEHNKAWNIRDITTGSRGFGVVANKFAIQCSWNGVDGAAPFRGWELKLR